MLGDGDVGVRPRQRRDRRGLWLLRVRLVRLGAGRPPTAWRNALAVGSIVSLLIAVAGGILTWQHWQDGTAYDEGTSRTFGLIVGIEFALAGGRPRARAVAEDGHHPCLDRPRRRSASVSRGC